MRGLVKRIAKKVMIGVQAISPALATKILFKKYMGYPLDMKNPKTLTEKMQWLKLKVYRNDPLVRQCVDKYAVRDYVKSCGREDLLVNLLGTWDDVAQIDWDSLPQQFVLKCNHGSGSVIICRDKSTFDVGKAKIDLSKWLKEDFGAHRAELSYKGVQRKIICEEIIQTEDGKAPKDYKFFCSYGEPKFLFVASNRQGEEAYFDFFDLEWSHYPVENGHPNTPIELKKPENFEAMVKAARDLAGVFPIVRVDLYNENGKIYFGELTFLHFGGLHPFKPSEFDRVFGDMMPLKGREKI